MNEKSKKSNCFERNIINYDYEIKIGSTVITTQQRKLSMGEVKEYNKNNIDIMKNKDVFKAILKKDEIENKNKENIESIEKINKKIDELVKSKEDIDIEKTKSIDTRIKKLNTQKNEIIKSIDELKKEYDIDTKYLILNATEEVKKREQDLQTLLIAYTLTPNKFYGGYFKINDEIITNKDEIIEYVDALEIEDFNNLYNNAKKLLYPTPDEINDAK